MVYGFEIINPGTGISGTDFKLLLNDNDGAVSTEIDLTVNNSGVGSSAKGVIMTSYSAPLDFQAQTNGTVRASVVPGPGITATTLPVIRPLVAPILGFGYTPTADLPSFYAGLAVNYNGDVGGELSTSVSYRQISLLRNPTRFDDDSPSPTGDGLYDNEEVYNTLRRFEFGALEDLSNISAGNIITETTTGLTETPAKA